MTQTLEPLQPLLDAFEPSDDEIAQLRADILHHLEALDLPSWAGADGPSAQDKVRIRAMHAQQRKQVLERERGALGSKFRQLLQHIADGAEVSPEKIDPVLIPVKSDSETADLFRFATLLWSVPVSKGYGRRMRYLVVDRNNDKLIGVFALTDPVFNLRARDEWVGWTTDQRKAGLIHVMDAYVVGAVPPYSSLLGGKLVTSLIGSAEVGQAFARRYREKQGIISHQRKAARLVMVTVTSALGRSSLYNRLKLQTADDERRRTLVELIRVGSTQGYGHFHLAESHFRRLRQLVRLGNHKYADAHQYGEGPNWRIRLSRVGLAMLGLDPELLRHGISREIYVMPLAANCREFLTCSEDQALIDRPTATEIADAALARWVIPRARRVPQFRGFRREDLLSSLS